MPESITVDSKLVKLSSKLDHNKTPFLNLDMN